MAKQAASNTDSNENVTSRKRQWDQAGTTTTGTTQALDNIPLPPVITSSTAANEAKRQKVLSGSTASDPASKYDGLSQVAAAYASANAANPYAATYSANPTTYTYAQDSTTATGYGQATAGYGAYSASTQAAYASASIVGYPQTYAQPQPTSNPYASYAQSAMPSHSGYGPYNTQGYSSQSSSSSNAEQKYGDYYFENPYLNESDDDDDDYDVENKWKRFHKDNRRDSNYRRDNNRNRRQQQHYGNRRDSYDSHDSYSDYDDYQQGSFHRGQVTLSSVSSSAHCS